MEMRRWNWRPWFRQVLKRRAERSGDSLEEREKRLRDREDQFQAQMRNLLHHQDCLEKEQAALGRERKGIEARKEEVTGLAAQWTRRLEELASIDAARAHALFLEKVEREARDEARELNRRIVDRARNEARKEARRILSIVLHRYAGEQTASTTSTAILLRNDELKGRIIGRDGRNRRAFENVTGMTLLIDDSSNLVTISGFDPVRREIARDSMERLVADGRIHPARIEQVVERVTSEMDSRVIELGERALHDLRLSSMEPSLIRHLGHLYFRQSFSQNLLAHSIEVAQLSRLLAVEMQLDGSLAARAGLLHDIGKTLGPEIEGSHAQAGARLIGRHGECAEVVEAVASHHDEVEPPTVLGKLVGTADAISASRPGARNEPGDSYIDRIRILEDVGLSFPGVDRCYAFQAGREVRVFVRPEEVSDQEARDLAKKVCRRIEETVQYPGQIQVTVIRESRCIDYAK